MIGFGVSYAFATTGWQEPTQAPPGGNTSAPVNVGTVDQVKESGLSLDKLAVFGQVVIQDGTEGAGKVLTSDANGVASWGDTGGGSGGAISKITLCPGTISAGPVECQLAAKNSGLGDGTHRPLSCNIGYSVGTIAAGFYNQPDQWWGWGSKSSNWYHCADVLVITYSTSN